jgi:hypothetical protein
MQGAEDTTIIDTTWIGWHKPLHPRSISMHLYINTRNVSTHSLPPPPLEPPTLLHQVQNLPTITKSTLDNELLNGVSPSCTHAASTPWVNTWLVHIRKMHGQ